VQLDRIDAGPEISRLRAPLEQLADRGDDGPVALLDVRKVSNMWMFSFITSRTNSGCLL
jgi:hypothetical protein